MSKASSAANAVVYAAEQVCALYGVQVTREQSRMFNVQGAAGRWRPMFIGQWTDDLGKVHHAGKPDLLARPKILVRFQNGMAGESTMADPAGLLGGKLRITVPLWIECKSGAGKLEPHQWAFKSWVEKNGDSYLLIHDDVRTLIAWFDAHGVERHCDDVELRNVAEPMDASLLHELPCRWCKGSRGEHIGPALGCGGKMALSGKVWSPNLKAARP